VFGIAAFVKAGRRARAGAKFSRALRALRKGGENWKFAHGTFSLRRRSRPPEICPPRSSARAKARTIHRHGDGRSPAQRRNVRCARFPVFTAFPEALEGRVKLLHPRVHGGLLYKRGIPNTKLSARVWVSSRIDLVVVNLYPFEATTAKPDVTLAERSKRSTSAAHR